MCHTWCRNAGKHVSAKCRQNVLFGDGKKQFDTFLKLAQGAFYPLPQKKVTLQSSILTLNRSQSLEAFIGTCGTTFLHSLFITYQDESHFITSSKHNAPVYSECNSNTNFDNNLFPSITELPFLKHFHYEELPSDSDGCYMLGKSMKSCLKGYILFDKLLRASVNLERLDLILQDTDLSKTEKHFMSLVNCSKSYGTLRYLRTLMLKLPLQDYHFELLRKANLQHVSDIQLRFQNEQCSVTSPLKFFSSFASSLNTLSTNIWMKGFSDRKMSWTEEDLIIPCLPNLDTLELSQWRSFLGDHREATRGNLLPFNFSYNRSFPCLRRLTLQSHCWERCWNSFFPMKEVCHTLQELKLPKMLESNRGIVIPKIAQTFPSLKKLDLTVIPSSVDLLSEIFCYLWRLEELSVNFLHGSSTTRNIINNNNVGEGVGGGGRASICIDYVMTGIPEAICKRIYSEDKIPNVQVDRMDTGYSLASLKCKFTQVNLINCLDIVSSSIQKCNIRT